MITRTFTDAESGLSALFDEVIQSGEIVIITRSGGESVALISTEELQSLLETCHLTAAPKNAQRLLSSLQAARQGEGEPATVEDLRAELGLDVMACLDAALEEVQHSSAAPEVELELEGPGHD